MERLRKSGKGQHSPFRRRPPLSAALILGALVLVVFYIFWDAMCCTTPHVGQALSLCCASSRSACSVRHWWYAKAKHLRVTMFDDKLGKKGVAATDLLATLCVFVFSVFLIVYGIQLTSRAHGTISPA